MLGVFLSKSALGADGLTSSAAAVSAGGCAEFLGQHAEVEPAVAMLLSVALGAVVKLGADLVRDAVARRAQRRHQAQQADDQVGAGDVV